MVEIGCTIVESANCVRQSPPAGYAPEGKSFIKAYVPAPFPLDDEDAAAPGKAITEVVEVDIGCMAPSMNGSGIVSLSNQIGSFA